MEKLTRIVFTGPESCGKTTLSEMLSEKLQLPLVTEFARQYIVELLEQGRKYALQDVLYMGKMQAETERLTLNQTSLPIVCDTDLTVICIWLKFVFGKRERSYEAEIKRLVPFTHYFLCYPDLPWEPDPQREHPENRMELFEMYENLLKGLEANYSVVRGGMDERFDFCVEVVERLRK